MSAQPTPGPWHMGGIFTLHPGEEYVDVWGPTPQGMQSSHQVCQRATAADARLIASAPTLLAALQALHRICRDCDAEQPVADLVPVTEEEYAVAMVAAEAAIADATGSPA